MSDARLGVTMGDPSGVGPELCAALIERSDPSVLARLLFFADRIILERAFTQVTGKRLPDTFALVDRGLLSPDQATPGRPGEAGARAQVGYLEAAAKAAAAKTIAGIVTAPVSKAQCARAGVEFPGQTEFFANRLGASEVAMLFVGPSIHVVLATTHVPLAGVSVALTDERLDQVIELSVAALKRDLGIETPRIGVLGLNPHAGEGGLLGSEEQDVIAPAVARAKARHPTLSFDGPVVPDAAFRPESLERFDLLVAMYHDQGLIPLKVIDFDHTVNVTIGLPIVRTSPDHGVAYDIAGQGVARPESFITATHLALEMMDRRTQG